MRRALFVILPGMGKLRDLPVGLNLSEIYPDRRPTRWADFDRHMPVVPVRVFGFKVSLAEINRWSFRYRAAASFDSVTLLDYQSKQTVKGYSALIRATLVWSAFERYLPIVGLDQKSCGPLLQDYDSHTLSASVMSADTGGRFFKYVRRRVTNSTLKCQLDSYANGDPFNASYLLSGVRHIFGHGHLTPGSNDTEPAATIEICNLLSDFHLKVMDEDFSKHVEEFEEMMADHLRDLGREP